VLAASIAADLRAKLYRAIEYLQLTFFDKKQVGAITSRVTQDTDRVWGFLVDGVPYFVSNGLLLAGIMVFLFRINWQLTLYILAPIPIVVAIVGDALASGIVTSLARPEANLTGSTYFLTELNAKRLELLKDVFPHFARVAILSNPDNPVSESIIPAMTAAAAPLKIELELAKTQGPTEFDGALEPRHVDLRPFVFMVDPDDLRVLPGGMTRVALDAGALVVNSSQNGGAKDTWVMP